ncbi:MAG: class I SAM-dependent methyltransferase [Phycisphaerae bacterium]|nr:class I SAM-dependent methyltransferase [Phycisphaerae bacterium]MDD5381685.1 class I SAM-dependent methyltransferase [Phycisphaerae bacterium]
MPTNEELNLHYEQIYYETLGENRSMTDRLKDPDGFYMIQYEDRLRLIKKYLRDDLPRSIMDIGAGYGDFLSFMKTAGWKTQGIEPSKYAYELIEDKEELDIKCASIDELINLGLKPVSVVTINNVLEHLNFPQGVLETVRKCLLLPNGIVFVAVPNDFSVLQNLLMQTVLKDKPDKQNYWVHPPEHLNYWSHKTIVGFMRKCEFEIEFLTTDFPMEIFPLTGEDYITKPDVGRSAHLKRVGFEKYLHQAHAEVFKDSLYLSLAQLGIGRNMYIVAKPI